MKLAGNLVHRGSSPGAGLGGLLDLRLVAKNTGRQPGGDDGSRKHCFKNIFIPCIQTPEHAVL